MLGLEPVLKINGGQRHEIFNLLCKIGVNKVGFVKALTLQGKGLVHKLVK